MGLQLVAQHVRDPVMGERRDLFGRGELRGIDRLAELEAKLGCGKPCHGQVVRDERRVSVPRELAGTADRDR